MNKANPLRHKVDENLFMVLSTKKINRDVQYLEQWYRQIFQNGISSWSDYKNNRYYAHVIRRRPNLFSCTCYEGTKKGACRHSLYVMIILDIIKLPPGFQYRQIQDRRHRGRPKNVSSALMRD